MATFHPQTRNGRLPIALARPEVFIVKTLPGRRWGGTSLKPNSKCYCDAYNSILPQLCLKNGVEFFRRDGELPFAI